MASGEESSPSLIDDDRYRAEVLGLDRDETEARVEARLVAEAAALGLRLPDIQIAASLAASISAGCLDIVSPASSASTPTRSSLANSSLPDVLKGGGAAAASVDHLASSFSDTTLSDRGHSDSIPSIDSSSTCPTSISSYDARPSLHNERYPRGSGGGGGQRNSYSSVARSTERKRSSFIHAIGKPFRRRRMPSAVNLPLDAQITLRREGAAGTVLVETKTVTPSRVEHPDKVPEKMHVEVPVFDEASMQRSLDNEQLRDMFNTHKAVRLRFVRLQNNVLDTLKAKHLAVIAEQKMSNEIAEREKEKQNTAAIARMEERQLEIEIEQIKEFDKAKRHSEIRIRHMEGYFHTQSPPQSPALGSDAAARAGRTVTQRQKEQLAQEYHDRDSMNQLHNARVKVLRERQERQLQETTARLENELEALVVRNADSITDLERDHQREEQEILQAFDGKKAKLRWRWNIEEAILRKKLQQRDGKPYGPLPTISFSSQDDEVPVLRNPFAEKSVP
ncbi:hypothetical protein PISL3812_00142 [Talaromyces islandicus]|uniref:Uncharacterized protein n=1 Tax=Talaromyces islandicus TaxID=28573 RepID=A0A0U1LK57_TALIS|nr:hypothetical protein PISL3812_00142 [Talaromyces islandicus]